MANKYSIVKKSSAESRKKLTNAIPFLQITETRPIEINGQLYHIIGQGTSASPLYAHFDVQNQAGERANQEIGVTVYTKISKILVTKYLHLTKQLLQAQADSATNEIEEMDKEFGLASGQNMTELMVNAKNALYSLEKLETQSNSLIQLEHWTIASFQDFNEKWDQFWEVYEQRIEHLFQFRTYILENKLLDKINKSLQVFFDEANYMYHLFTETIPVHTPLMTNIEDLILLNEQLGRTDEDEYVKDIVTPWENFSQHFFQKGFFTFAGLTVISLILAITGITSYNLFFTLFLLSFLLLIAFAANTPSLARIIERRIRQRREEQLVYQPIIQSNYKQELAQQKQTSELNKTEQEPYEFTGRLVRFTNWLLGIGIFILLLGLVLLTDPDRDAFYITGVGLIIVLLSLWFPKTRVMRRRFRLQAGKLSIGRRTDSPEEIIKIVKGKRNKIIVHSHNMPDPITYKLSQEQSKEILLELKNWCAENYVLFEEK